MLFPITEFFYVSGLTFVNYVDGAPLSVCVTYGCTCGWVGGAPLQSDGVYVHGVTQRTERLRFINSPQRIFWDRSDVIIDLDGSLTGKILTHFTSWPHFNTPHLDTTLISSSSSSSSSSTLIPSSPSSMFVDRPRQHLRHVILSLQQLAGMHNFQNIRGQCWVGRTNGCWHVLPTPSSNP